MRIGVTAGVLLGTGLLLGSCGDPADPSATGSLESSSGSTAASDATVAASESASSTAVPTGSGPSTGPQDTTEGPADTTSSDSSGSDTTGDPMMGETGVVRFAAFGDTGEGNEAQQMVANAAELVCADRGCDFALLLGDNFYDEGVTSSMDQQFIDKFETVYAGLDMPFYVVLGNHDYGQLANDWMRGNYQVEYSAISDKWTLPHFWYSFTSESGGTQFFAFDTARMMWNHDVADQRDWLAQEMAASTAAWKIAIAHHPYIS
ncbi:MAG: metallophosphoesterase, partial [Myxococcales bacterium]|nr:metallophosphoesterase [Myxococcales bacterium]